MIALAGCSNCNPVARCSIEVSCGTGAHCVDTYCVLDGTGQGGGSGGTGGGAAGGSGGGGPVACNISQLAWVTPPSSVTTTKDAGIALALSVSVGLNCSLSDFPPVTVTATQGATHMLMPAVTATMPSSYVGSVTFPVDGTWSLVAKLPDGGQAATSINVDSTPPKLVLEVPPPLDCPHPNLDCNDAVFANTAWRRNQTVQARVKASEALVAPSLRLYSINADGGFVTVARDPACTTFCDAGDCACFTLELWKPMMNAYRGQMKIEVVANDSAGNVTEVDGSIKVTRFNWSRTISDNGEVRATPAIGWDGTVYVGTKGSNDGKLVAVSPSGQEKFSFASGMVEASPTVSPPDAGIELIYVGGNNSGGTSKIYALRPNGTSIIDCPGNAPITASPVVAHSTAVVGGASTNAIFQVGKISMTEIRPQALLTNCRDFGNDADVPFPGNLTYGSGLVTAGDTRPQLRGYDADQVLTFVERKGNNWDAGNVGFGTVGQVTALASATQLVGSRFLGGLPNTLYRATMGASFSVDQQIAVPTTPTGPAIGPMNDVWLGHTSQLEVYASDAGVSMPLPAVLGTYTTTPLLGEGQRLFALVNANANNPQIQSYLRISPAITEWTGELSTSAISFLASPTMDCSRDINGVRLRGRPGVLYAVSNTRTLYSVIVDSRGIDTNAPWPKYQRDPRNSGSADTQLAEFDCR